jgi:SNF2 family DNA or RNA helicase
MSEAKFTARFNPSLKTEGLRKDGSTYIYIDERTGRHAELQNRLRANYMVRHLKREVMPQLKLPLYDLIYVSETKAVKAALAAESLLDIDPTQLAGADMAILGHVSEVRRMMGVALAPQVVDYVDMLMDGGEEKITIFAWHTEVLDILENGLSKWGILRIDGSTPPSRRPKLVHQFKSDPGIQIILGNMQAMGIGTDGLQEVSCHALIAEPDWVPGNNIQCFDRLDRGGQQRQVQGEIFVAPNSFAEKVLASALHKNQTIHKALDRKIA